MSATGTYYIWHFACALAEAVIEGREVYCIAVRRLYGEGVLYG